MNPLNLKMWSQRQQVTAVILMAGALIFLLVYFCLLPLNARRADLEREIEKMRSQLARKNLLHPEDVLQKTRDREQEHANELHDEWLSVAERLAAADVDTVQRAGAVGHIDYKVTLYEVRHRLREKARALNIRLPDDLGMDAAVRSHEDSRKLMLQLRTVEKLADLSLDLQINMLRHIDPQPPVVHRAPTTDAPFLEEYPVRVEFYGNLQNVYDLFYVLLQPEQVFALRRLRVEAASRKDPELLRVQAVMSSILFLRDPRELIPKKVKRVGHSGPMGH